MAKLTDLSVSFLSLVARPATGKGLTLKSKEGEVPTTFDLRKTDDELMIAYGIVYAPDQTDLQGDSADAKVIRRAAQEFMREGRLKNIDLEHSFDAEMAFVAESWIVRKGDPLFGDEPDGAWAVGIRIGDPDIWRKLKAGDLTGISLAGIARAKPEETDPDPMVWAEKDEVPGWFARLLGKSKTEEKPEVTKEEIAQIAAAAAAEVLKSAGVTPTDPPADPPADPQKTGAADDDAALTQDDVQKTVDAAIAKAFEAQNKTLADTVAKAVAKGVTETGSDPEIEDSFA